MFKQYTTFTPTNISGTTILGETPINININQRTVTGNFSIKNVPNASVSVDIETKTPSINLNGVSDLTPILSLIEQLTAKLIEIVDEITA